MENIALLAEALSKAQAEFTNPHHNKTAGKPGDKFSYTYADLASIIESVRPSLAKHGLSTTQVLVYDDDKLCLKTALIHTSGQLLASYYPMPDPSRTRPQEFGSALTYARRYSLSAILGIASEEDDDAQVTETAPKQAEPKNPMVQRLQARAATAPPATPVAAPTQPTAPINTQGGPGVGSRSQGPSEAQLKRLYAIAYSAHWTHEQVSTYIRERWEFDNPKYLNRVQYEALTNEIMPKFTFNDAYADMVHDREATPPTDQAFDQDGLFL